VTGRDCATPSVARRDEPAGGQLLAEHGRRAKFGKAPARTSAPSCDHPGRPRAVGAGHRGRIFDEGASPRLHAAGGAGPVAHPAVGRPAASLTYLEERTWGRAGAVDPVGRDGGPRGLALVVAFLLLYYKLSGVNAIVSMVINLVVLLAAMSYFDATMTLRDRRFILTSAWASLERPHLRAHQGRAAAQKGVKQAIAAGFDRVFLTISTRTWPPSSRPLLFQFGTGPIRGFATTLSIGLLSNVFTSVFVSRNPVRLSVRAPRR